VRGRLSLPDARRGFILDGYPRTVPQADVLETILAEQGPSLDAVVLIEVPEPVLIARALARKRADDTEAAIRERLAEYGKKTEPLIGYYGPRGLLREVDGRGSIAEVAAAVGDVLGVPAGEV
jgi:adenylate kinase